MSSSAWERQLELDIPWIVAATSERFLPQMLGLQRLQAFSLRKGCFPGQEVVARTHFLGRVKRRLVRLLRTSGDVSLAPGAELCLQAGASAAAGVLLSTAEDHLPTLAVVTDEAVAGSVLQAMNPRENATFVIDRDVIGTIGDEVLNGRYDPPFSA
ncbi:MAG: tRNA-modifying protein YgfZ [Rhodanobacteraceae bacterium]|nr:tRNA-modifying protein YgfZ [Rhodanobacteraceae bacterium]